MVLLLVGFVAMIVPRDSFAQAFRVEPKLVDGRLVVDHQATPQFYYILQRLNLQTGSATPVDLEPGNLGSVRLQDPNSRAATGFYRVSRVRNEDPSDLDNDGMDDLYEMNHPPLDPLNRNDASQISPVTGRTNLEDYFLDTSNLGLYPYLVGRGMHDVTGPAADGSMMGYAEGDQKSAGIHDRQWARAFVVAGRQPAPADKRVAFVVVDTGQVFGSITQGVYDRLQADDDLRNFYSVGNIVLSATHTHGGAGGHSHHVLYNASIGGFAWQTYDAMVHGIYMAIKKAHRHLAPGRIVLNKGLLANANENRQTNGFYQNVEVRHSALSNPFGKDNRDTEMLCLRFEHANRREIGMFNWFPVHGVSFSKENHLLTGDNKGLAAYLFEKAKGTYYPGHGRYAQSSGFVAGFANSNPGDLTANRWTSEPGEWPANGKDDSKRADLIGTRQFDKALSLYTGAEGTPTRVFGAVDFRHMYVDMTSVRVNPPKLYPYNVSEVGFPESSITPPWETYIGALGIDFAKGTRDGEALSQSHVDAIRLLTGIVTDPITAEFERRHAPKDILLTTGTQAIEGLTWTPQTLPISILRIGNLAILSVPAEFTSMAGSRLRKTVESILGPDTHAVIAGLANDYSGYVTTYEEYVHQTPSEFGVLGQSYEAASTQFGAFTLAAYQTKFTELAQALVTGQKVATLPMPRTDPPSLFVLKASDPILDLPPLPQAGPAEYKGKAGCPDGQFLDILTGSCWSCPPGYTRTVFPVEGDTACEIPANSVFSVATQHGPVGCGPGQFYDIFTAACWSCPAGYNRTIFAVNGSTACEKPAQTLNSVATRQGQAGCGPGQFFDLITGACWSCPSGYNRTIFAVNGSAACERPAYSSFGSASSTAGTGIFGTDCPSGYVYDFGLGRCYRCPSGSAKVIFQAWNSSSACETVHPAVFSSATRYDGLCPNGQFLDIGTGYCWTCPAGYNRTIFGIGTATACEKVIPAVLSSATRYGGLCPIGEFWDIGTGYCWSCPAGYNRTVLAVQTASACEKVIPTVSARASRFGKYLCEERGTGWFLDIFRDECWSCNGWIRNLNPVDSPEACTGPLVAFGDLADPLWLHEVNARQYSRGQSEVVIVSFWGGHPKNVFGTINNRMLDALPTFLEVQLWDGAQWETVRTDADWDTTFEWNRIGAAASLLTVTWDLRPDTKLGAYRILHHGFSLDASSKITPYQGESPVFQVVP